MITNWVALKQQKFIHSSGGQKSEIRVSAWLILSGSSVEYLFCDSVLASGGCQQSLTFLGCLTPISASVVS